MPQKCDISVWPIATPSTIIVNVHCLHHTASIKYILYIRFQKYCLKCTSDWAHKKLQYFNGEFHSLVIGDFCARIIPPWDLHVPFTCIIGSPAILFLAIYCYITFALSYTFLYINDVKKIILAKPQRSSLRIHLCVSERSERAIFWSFLIVLQLKSSISLQ